MSGFLESLWNEIRDPQSGGSGAEGADDAEVDQALIRRMKLTYKGRDEQGNRIWEDNAGHQYVAAQLQKHSTDEPEGDSGGNTNKGGAPGNNSWQQYVPGGGATVPQNFGAQYFGSANPVLQQPVANPFKTTGSVRTVTAAALQPKTRSAFEPGEEKELLKSYLYIVSKDGRTVDDYAKAFFELLNKRAGEIFTHRHATGEVFLIKGASPDDVGASDTTSHILARTIMSGIMGGTGYNHALKKHDVYLRILPVDDAEGNNCLFDNWNNGMVDLRDLAMLLMPVPGTERDEDENCAKEILQAAVMGRIISERYATPEYERNKGIGAFYTAAHAMGIKRECEVVNEMTGSSFATTKANDDAYNLNPPSQRWFYPNKHPMNPPYLYAEIYFAGTSRSPETNMVIGSRFIKVSN